MHRLWKWGPGMAPQGLGPPPQTHLIDQESMAQPVTWMILGPPVCSAPQTPESTEA